MDRNLKPRKDYMDALHVVCPMCNAKVGDVCTITFCVGWNPPGWHEAVCHQRRYVRKPKAA